MQLLKYSNHKTPQITILLKISLDLIGQCLLFAKFLISAGAVLPDFCFIYTEYYSANVCIFRQEK